MEETQNVKVNEIPHDLENEGKILGSIIVDDRLIRDCVDSVTYKMFYDKLHQKTYSAMLYLHHNHVKIGYETLIDRLSIKLKDEMNKGEIADYVINLAGSIASLENFESRLELLIDTFKKREIYDWALHYVQTDVKGIASANIVKQVESKIEGMGITTNIELEDFSSYIDEWTTNLETPEEGKQTFKMGYKLLDEMVLIEPSNLMLISARPSLGKSAFALNVAKNFCIQGANTLFVSLEMSKKEIMNRLVANIAEIEAKKLKRKLPLETYEWTTLLKAKETIKQWNLNIYDKGAMYIEQLDGLCKHLKKKGELDVLIVDYLQLLDSHAHNKNRVQQVSFISRKLKQIAMELEIPVIALSQLSRAGVSEGGKPREPQLSDLRESGK